jgi:hypothetical protein
MSGILKWPKKDDKDSKDNKDPGRRLSLQSL